MSNLFSIIENCITVSKKNPAQLIAVIRVLELGDNYLT